MTKYAPFSLPQLSHPVEICEQGSEANERLLGGEHHSWGQGGTEPARAAHSAVSQGGNVPRHAASFSF